MKKTLITIIILLIAVPSVYAAGSILNVLNGGTGVQSFGQGWISSAGTSGGKVALTSSTSPTVNYLVATSTQPSLFPYASTTAVSVSTELTIPSSAAPSILVAGDIGIDTTSNQLQLFDTAKRVIIPVIVVPFNISSTTWGIGTTTIPLGIAPFNETFTTARCATSVGTVQVSIYTAALRMNWIQASTTVGTTTLSTNNVISQGTAELVDVGTSASAPKWLACSFTKTYDAN